MKNWLFSSLVSALACSSAAFADQIPDSFEVCVPSGECALAVTDTESGSGVYLVTGQSRDLSLIWPNAVFWEVSETDYAEVKKLIPLSLMLPAVDPDSGLTLERAKGGSSSGKGTGSAPTSGGTSSGSTGGGLISVGNITIGGGGNTCGDCHKGNMREIHKKVLPSN